MAQRDKISDYHLAKHCMVYTGHTVQLPQCNKEPCDRLGKQLRKEGKKKHTEHWYRNIYENTTQCTGWEADG